ncbi:substrate-binding domain-containing protein [Amedibacillus sp. YH-ame6]
MGITLLSFFVLSLTVLQFKNYAQNEISAVKAKPIKFGATYMTLNNPFFDLIDSELRNVIEANGDVLTTMDPQLSIERQREQVRYLIEQGCQVLIVNPVDSKGLADVLKEAKKQGIYIIAIDTNVYESDSFVDYSVVSDNYEAGVLCAQKMMAQKKEANIFLLKHESAHSAVERIQGFKDTIKGNANYRIVGEEECEGQLEKSMPIIKGKLEDKLEFDVVMALNDPSALGAIAALQEKDMLSNVMVYGVDGTPEAKVLVRDGFLQGTVAQYPKKMAKKAIDAAYQFLDGKRYVKKEKIDVVMIDQNNISEFSLEGWQ